MQPILQNDMPGPCLSGAYKPQQKYTMVFQTSFAQLVAGWDKWRGSSNLIHTVIFKVEGGEWRRDRKKRKKENCSHHLFS